MDEKLKEKVIQSVEWLVDNNIFGYVQFNAMDGKIQTIAKHQTEKTFISNKKNLQNEETT